MAEKGQQEEEYASADPMGTAQTTNNREPVATEPLRYVGSDSDFSSSEPEKEKEKAKYGRREMDRTLTTTTTASSVAPPPSTAEPARKKPWYKRLNPLKRSKKPPIPEERIVSREYGANFFSMLTFQWMAPIMMVRMIPDMVPKILVILTCILGWVSTNTRTQRHLARQPKSKR